MPRRPLRFGSGRPPKHGPEGPKHQRFPRVPKALMSRHPLFASIVAAGAALAFPAFASAEIIEVGKLDPPATPSCPAKPCLAVSRTTGYQAKVGATRGLMTIPKDGSLVAWTISLGKPGTKQTTFFN